MPSQDTTQLKERMVSFLRMRGPSLPVHIAKDAGLSILFTSAFLSELVSEKRIKISNMRVGSSPIYFIPNHYNMLERYSEYLKSKEKEAYEILKERKFLKDHEQDPAIRVALRSIKDFAIAFNKNDEIIWRYFIIPESEFLSETKKVEEVPQKKEEQIIVLEKLQEKPMVTEIIVEKEEVPIQTIKKENKKVQKKVSTIKKTLPKVKEKKSSAPNKEDKFFNRVKEHLNKTSIEIIDLIDVKKDRFVLKVKVKNSEKILVAFNKKKLDEKDIIEASIISEEQKIPYIILTLGETSKKTKSFINAVKSMDSLMEME